MYCNRADTGWYATDTRLALAYRKPPKQAQIPDTPGRTRAYGSKPVMRVGQRIESARRLLEIGLDEPDNPKMRSPG
jgi:hypothetical protein